MTSIIRAVESEYGEPFWDVVRGFAADGHSVHATAELLGYASDTPFRRLLARHGMQIQFAENQASVFAQEARQARRGRVTPGIVNACRIASSRNPVYRWIEYQGVRDTVPGHCRRLGLSVSTVRKRLAVRPGDYAHAFARCSHVRPPRKVDNGWR